MAPGQGIWVGVTARNRGNTQWSPAAFWLKVLTDPCDLVSGDEIPLDALVNPNTSRQLLVFLSAPGAIGPCQLELRMEEFASGPVRLVSGPGVFGDLFSRTIRIAEPPSALRDWEVYE